jgi:D-sedoheptulose 7-phosphate isomerase
LDIQFTDSYFIKLREILEVTREKLAADINSFADLIVESLKNGNKILVMGNGGSAADAQHFAAEMVGRFLKERKGLPAIALNTNTSTLTAVANDYHFNEIFSRQVEALAIPGDVLIGISTSGNSANVIKALEKGKEHGCRTVSLSGRDGGRLPPLSDISLVVPADETPHIQEMHIVIIHLVCGLVENRLFP